MKREHLEYLACPICGDGLTPPQEKAGEVRIESGALSCASGCGAFPVEGGVPRLLPELCGEPSAHASPIEPQQKTSNSFGAQWKMYEYGGTTWGVTVEERTHVVLHELAWSPRDLAGKVVLDAGCGNGTLSCALAGLGATVVALDLSDSVFRARENCPSENVLFVQGNLFHPPFRRESFDAIYSCGVFHHTPDTRKCFDELVPALKKTPDSRYFVWLYAKRFWLFDLTVERLMKLTRKLPGRILVPLCVALAPVTEGILRASRALGFPQDAPRTLRDRAIQLHDLFAPAFVRYHSFEEAHEWARDAGFRKIERTSYSPGRGSPENVRRILEKYFLICRPGFGMLARY